MAPTAGLGVPAVPAAARNGNVRLVHLLLRQGHAIVFETHCTEYNSLMTMFDSQHPRVHVVRLLLQAGADPA